MFSPLRILYHFWIWPIHSYLKEPPCTLRTHSVETIQHYTLWRNKNKYECMVGYNFRSPSSCRCSREARSFHKFISKWKPMFSPLRMLYHFWIWPIHSYLKEPPCTLRTHSVETIQHYTLWRNKNKYECLVGYNFRSTQGRPTNLHPNKGLRSSLFEYHTIF